MGTFIRSQQEDEQRLCSLFTFGNFTAIVLTATFANMMRAFQLTAVGTLFIGGPAKSIVRPAHAAPGCRDFFLGNSHFKYLE